jgi:chemotaxis signal transduction protein
MEEHSAALDLLIFRVKGNRFGLDAAQIGEILELSELQLHRENSTDVYRAIRDGVEIPVVEIAAVIGMAESVPLEETKLVLPRSAGSDVAFLIGEPEEMVRVETADIELLPALIRPMVKGRGVWGIAAREEGAVLLIDLAEAAESIAVCNTADPG